MLGGGCRYADKWEHGSVDPDTGTSSDDTAGGDSGDSGDTGDSDEGEWEPLGGGWLDCGSWDTEDGDNFPSNHYPDWDGSEGTECRCIVDLEELTIPDEVRITVRGWRYDLDEDEEPDPGTMPFRVAVRPNYSDDFLMSDQTRNQDDYWDILPLTDWSAGNSIWGDWEIAASLWTKDSSFAADCDVFQEVQLYVEGGSSSAASLPPPNAVGPSGAEDDLDCVPEESDTTRYQLVTIRGWVHPVPVAVDGSSEFVGAEATIVEVVDWHGANRLKVSWSGGDITITPSNPEVTLPTGEWWIGGLDWKPWHTEGQSYSNPEVEITHSCPSSPASGTVSVGQGYALTLGDVYDAIEDATDSEGLAAVLAEGEETDWPVYVLRVVPAQSPPDGAPDYALRLEVRGDRAAVSVPMTSIDSDSWSIDADLPAWAFEGTVTRSSSSLTLDLDDGRIELPTGTLDLVDATLVLPELP